MSVQSNPPALADIVRRDDFSDAARDLYRDALEPTAYLKLLEQAGRLADALKLLSHWLPRREAVWWGCQCLWHVYRPAPPPTEESVLRAVVGWVFEPKEDRRRQAESAAVAAGPRSAAAFLARAAFYTEGSMSAPGLPDVPPPPDLAPKALVAALMLASADVPPEKTTACQRQFIRLGLDVAQGRHGWEEGQPVVAVPTTPAPPTPVAESPLLKKRSPKRTGQEAWEDLTQSDE
jgi:hypothetical protein